MDTNQNRTGSRLATLPESGELQCASPPGADLTEKQRIFAVQLFKLRDKTSAYMIAYPATKKRKNAGNEGRKLARHPGVAKYVETLANRITDLSAVTVSDIEHELGRVAFADIRQLCDARGEVLPPHLWPDDAALAVSSYSEHRAPNGTVTRKVRLNDRMVGLRTLAEVKGMTNPKPDTTQRAHFVIHLGGGQPAGGARGRAKTVKGRVLDQQPGVNSPLTGGSGTLGVVLPGMHATETPPEGGAT